MSERARLRLSSESGQAVVLLLGLAAALITGTLVLAGIGHGLGAKGRHQRAADLASVSAAHAMSDAHPRLLEPPYLRSGVPNPRHLTRAEYLARARAAAVRTARRNGVRLERDDVRFSGGDWLTPLEVEAAVRGEHRPRVPGRRNGVEHGPVPVTARATAELVPLVTGDLEATGGEYQGPFAYRQGKPMRPDVAQAFDRMEAAAKREAGISLIITSAFRSDEEQAQLYAENPDPRWVAPPGESLHRYGTELDLGPSAAYPWLERNAERFGFVQRYSWEPWHYGYVHNTGSTSVGFGIEGSYDGVSAVPTYVPARYKPMIIDASVRWKVSAALISAQLYVESGFNPNAVSPAGAQGIAQFMPATARAYGLRDPFDPAQAIDAQAHLMHDLLRRFGSVPLALAAYNAGPAPVAACGCVPPYPETEAYVAKILALIGGEAAGTGLEFEVRLIE